MGEQVAARFPMGRIAQLGEHADLREVSGSSPLKPSSKIPLISQLTIRFRIALVQVCSLKTEY